jgi:hypothetical protein
MDITKLSITELKALAYDLFVQAEVNQRNLQAINAEIQKKNKEEVKDVAPNSNS